MATREVERRPVRGGLWGLLLGVGAALLLIAYNVVALGTLPPYLVVVAGIAVGILWGTLGPAKGGDATPPPGDLDTAEDTGDTGDA